MILDLNKVLLYANPDGTLRDPGSAKRYIGVVDAVLAGEGHGPLSPERVAMGYLACGTNPVAIDATCATLMGFDPAKVPSIARAPHARVYPVCSFQLDQVRVIRDGLEAGLAEVPAGWIVPFAPQRGWRGHIERTMAGAVRVAAG